MAVRVAEAEDAIQRRPPAARPAFEICRLCVVRHLCEPYWNRKTEFETEEGQFVDRQGVVLGQHGSRSWIIELDPSSDRVLLRTPDENPSFSVGDKVRILSVARTRDDESEREALTVTIGSELFLLDDG